MVRKMIFGSTTTTKCSTLNFPDFKCFFCNKIQTKLTTNGEIKFEIVDCPRAKSASPLHYGLNNRTGNCGWKEGQKKKCIEPIVFKPSEKITYKNGKTRTDQEPSGWSDQSYRETSQLLNPTSTPGEKSDTINWLRLHYPKDSIAGPEQD